MFKVGMSIDFSEKNNVQFNQKRGLMVECLPFVQELMAKLSATLYQKPLKTNEFGFFWLDTQNKDEN